MKGGCLRIEKVAVLLLLLLLLCQLSLPLSPFRFRKEHRLPRVREVLCLLPCLSSRSSPVLWWVT